MLILCQPSGWRGGWGVGSCFDGNSLSTVVCCVHVTVGACDSAALLVGLLVEGKNVDKKGPSGISSGVVRE